MTALLIQTLPVTITTSMIFGLWCGRRQKNKNDSLKKKTLDKHVNSQEERLAPIRWHLNAKRHSAMFREVQDLACFVNRSGKRPCSQWLSSAPLRLILRTAGRQ